MSAKFALTVLSTLLLLLHQFTAVAAAAERVSRAALATLPREAVGPLGTQLVFDAGLALLVLIAITVLSIFKPCGRTPYGREQSAVGSEPASAPSSAGFKVALIAVGILVALLVVKHLVGGHHH